MELPPVRAPAGGVAGRGPRLELSRGRGGSGTGRAGAAVEFPEIHFRITDVLSDRTPNYQAAQAFAKSWNLGNVEFDTLDVCHPIEGRFDLIASTEVVEHIKDDELALRNMLDAADRFVFCLVPFADEKTLADPKKQRRAWERHEHYRYGYSPERFRQLFGEIHAMRGCYWRDGDSSIDSSSASSAIVDPGPRERAGARRPRRRGGRATEAARGGAGDLGARPFAGGGQVVRGRAALAVRRRLRRG